MWVELETEAANKGRKLWEANEQQQYYRAVKDVDLWLDEVEKQLASEDLGKVTGMIYSRYYAIKNGLWVSGQCQTISS